MTGLSRAAIRRLRSGLVPSWEFEFLSVGYDDVRRAVESSLGELKQSGRAEPLFVRGEWGTGKSHLLSFIQATAAKSGFASAMVELNARSAAPSHPQRFFPVLAEAMRVGTCGGLRAAVIELLHRTETRRALREFAETSRAADLGRAITSLCREYELGNRLELSNHPAWRQLYGADLCWSDSPSKRERALARIEAVACLFRAVGLNGLVLVLDEAETIDQLWNVRSRSCAYGVLERVCRMEATWCVLSTTMRFDRTVARDLDDAITTNSLAREFLATWRRGERRTVEPPTVDARNAQDLAAAIQLLYESAFAQVPDSESAVERCLSSWARNPSRNPRRLIRLLVDELDCRRPLLDVGECAHATRG
ncbi:MAG: DUF2791 family P-loop domain-containing protein [Enhydrobacter sp.]|nr:MAG: DUF2791 family P-loop domain-containing protein [Enhydrobacter sp.]